MKTNSSENTDPRWQKTLVANLVRHVQSGNYYARIRLRGKLIWKSRFWVAVSSFGNKLTERGIHSACFRKY